MTGFPKGSWTVARLQLVTHADRRRAVFRPKNKRRPAEPAAGCLLVDADGLKQLLAERAVTLDPKSGAVS